MFFPIPIFIPQFPYVRFKEINLFKGKTMYEKHTMGGHVLDSKHKRLIHDNQNLLLEHQVPINKIRFVFQPTFTYDIDKNVINPVYHAFLPINGNNGLFAKDEPVIEVGKPEHLITVFVGSYKMEDNYAYLKETLKRCKKGVVIMLDDEIIYHYRTNESKPYEFIVDDEVIRFAVLDDAIEHYKTVKSE